jgi:hypothetical protein
VCTLVCKRLHSPTACYCDCRYAANYAALGFVDVTHGCSSILTIGNYKTGDEYTRADTTATFPAAAVLLRLSVRQWHSQV